MKPILKRIESGVNQGVQRVRKALGSESQTSTALDGELQPLNSSTEEVTPRASDNYQRYGVIGITILVFGLGGAILWAALAPLASAVVTSGEVVLQDYRTTIQHIDGGVIETLAVEEAQEVSAGDLLFRLEDSQARSDYAVISNRLLSALGEQARLRAERDKLDAIEFPDRLTNAEDAEEAAETMANERAIFTARKQALETDLDRRAQRIDELNERIGGLESRLESVNAQITSYQEEVEERRGLVAEQLSSKEALRNAERRLNDLRGERGRLNADIAGTRAQIATTRMERSLRQQEYDQQVANALGEIQEQILDTEARAVALRARLDRTEVRAPVDGSVVGLAVHSEGGVISPGQEIMDIVPTQRRLLLDAQVPTDEVNNISVGQITTVSFPALSSRFADNIEGEVVSISADALTNEQTGQRYYLARIRITRDGLDVLREQDFQMSPGMPVTTNIQTGTRSMLDYLLKPLAEKVTYAFREE